MRLRLLVLISDAYGDNYNHEQYEEEVLVALQLLIKHMNLSLQLLELRVVLGLSNWNILYKSLAVVLSHRSGERLIPRGVVVHQ